MTSLPGHVLTSIYHNLDNFPSERNRQLQEELAALPKVRAELKVAEEQITEGDALMAKAGEELTGLQTSHQEAVTRLTEAESELVARARQEDQGHEKLQGVSELLAKREEELQQSQATCQRPEAKAREIQKKVDEAVELNRTHKAQLAQVESEIQARRHELQQSQSPLPDGTASSPTSAQHQPPEGTSGPDPAV